MARDSCSVVSSLQGLSLPNRRGPQASTAALCALRLLLALSLLVALGQLTACSGGGDDGTYVPTPAAPCAAHPELCK